MTTTLRIALGLTLLATSACSKTAEAPSPAPAEATETVNQAQALGAPGRVHTYRFEWVSRSQGRGPAIVPEDMPLTGGVTLTGKFAVRVHGPVQDGTLVGVTLQSLEEAELLVLGQDVLTETQPLLGAEALVVVPPRGGVHDLYFAPNTAPLARELLASLVGRFDLRIPSQPETTGRVTSSQGLARAAYLRDGKTVRKQLVAALRTDADVPADAGQPQIQGEGTVDLADDASIERLQNSDVLIVPSTSERPHLRSETRFVAQRESVHDEAPRPLPDLSELQPYDLWASPDDEEARRLEARRYAGDLTTFDVSIAVRSAANGLLPERGFAIRAVGMLRGYPETTSEMIEIFEASEKPAARQLVFDLLASAGTPQCQAAMRELAGRPEVEQADDYPSLIQRFSFIARPEPETASFLVQTHARAIEAGRTEARTAALYPMGSVAGALQGADPLLATALLEAIRDDLALAQTDDHLEGAIAGLGNAADPMDLPRVLEATRAKDVGVRGMAAVSLRRFPRAESTDRLFEMLADPDPYVARRALESLEQHPLGPQRADRLAAVALTGTYEPDLAFALGNAMLSEESATAPLQKAALVAMTDRNTDPTTSRHLHRWLSTL